MDTFDRLYTIAGMLIDVTLAVRPDMPHWPGSTSPLCEWETRMDRGEESDASKWTLSAHQGTHVDAPSHFIPGAAGIEDVPLDLLCGPVYVVEIPEDSPIRADHVAELPPGVERVLFRTTNSTTGRLFRPFDPGYVAVSAQAAEALVAKGIRLVGIDYLSVECFGATDFPAHHTLLGAGVPIIEGLDLAAAEPGHYQLTCLPIRLTAAEAAPARVILTR
jgi:arylformamidase